MADIIQLLPDSIANQIAAGEVIQRPASVLKELMENGIDAGATSIQVIMKDAGKTGIQVIDNGKGMSETDARMSVERHATSKIREANDLFAIKTMGFRGEALASIVAIAHVEIKTRRPEDEFGTRIVIHGTEVKTQEPCQMLPGTSISVKNLFYNVPARRKFLKSDTVELRHLVDEFTHIALAFPELEFSLHHNEKELFILPPGKLRPRIIGIIGKRANDKIVPIDEETNYVKIKGFVGKPDFARKSRGEQYLFVNQRYVKSHYLNFAIKNAFEDLIPQDHHPFYVLFLEMDPAQLDINVHPTKQEIKFEDERLIYNYLRVAIRHGLGKYSITPSLDFEQEAIFSGNAPRTDPNQEFGFAEKDRLAAQNLEHWEKIFQGMDHFSVEPEQPDASQILTRKTSLLPDTDGEADKVQLAALPPFQLNNSLLVVHNRSGLILIDQQAAHERILFEQFKAILANENPSTQKTLFPITWELSPSDAAILADVIEHFRQLGFDIEHFGAETYIVHGLPAQMMNDNPLEMLQNILEQFKNNLDIKTNTSERIAMAMAASASIKRGKNILPEERHLIVDRLFACENPYTNPRGKKCFITIELEELYKRFNT